MIRTACPTAFISYTSKGSPYGDNAFQFPWDAWLETEKGTNFCREYRFEGFFMRRLA